VVAVAPEARLIRYHGTPLTPRSELWKMAGKNFCVSFAEHRDADWCVEHGQAVMWDNGAFTTFTQGKAFDAAAFFAWVEPRLGHPHWAVVPDVIDGSVEDQRERIAQWPFGMWHGAPVWHLALPVDWLLELADAWPRVCFGSSGAYWQVGGDAWARRADEAFNALDARGLRPWVHMLRGMDLAGDRWPFASVDSVNVARNYSRNEVCPERMARLIDGRRNSPIRWNPRPEQMGMFA
jgi:hypothetical protein